MVCALDVLHVAVHRLISQYCTSFQPGYIPEWDQVPRDEDSIASYSEQLLRLRVSALHRPIEAELRK